MTADSGSNDKPSGEGDGAGAAKLEAAPAAEPEAKPEVKTEAKPEVKTDAKAETKPGKSGKGGKGDKADKSDDDKGDGAADEPAVARAATASMPAQAAIGAPPDEPAVARAATASMPAEAAVGAPPVAPGDVEQPTRMPAANEIPDGNPSDPAAAPGRVPSGDSRSLRRGNEFALVYRVQTCVISRFGVVGTRGQWRVVDYPTSSSAASSYAKECSRFVSEGFSDYRD